MTHSGGDAINMLSRWGRVVVHMGELLSALCPSYYHRASEGVNKEALKVLNRGLTCDSFPPLQTESIVMK